MTQIARDRKSFKILQVMSTTTTAHPPHTSAMDGVLDLQSEHMRHTRGQIMTLVAEIAMAARQPQSRDQFFAIALQRMREAMGAEAAALWQVDQRGDWTTVSSVNIPECLARRSGQYRSTQTSTDGCKEIEDRFDSFEQLAKDIDSDNPDLPEDDFSEPSPAHVKILDIINAEQQPTLVPPSAVASVAGRPTNPSPFCLGYAPIALESEGVAYWLQAVVVPNGGPATHRGYLRFVVQIAEIIADFMRADQLRRLQRERGVFDTAQQILGSLDRIRVDSPERNSNTRSIGQEEEAAVASSIMQWLEADETIFIYRTESDNRIRLGARANDLRISEQGTACIELKDFVRRLVTGGPASQPLVLNFANDQERMLHELFGARAIGWLPIQVSNKTNRSKSAFVALILLWYRGNEAADHAQLLQKLDDISPVARIATRFATASTAGSIANAITTSPRRALIRKLISSSILRICVLTCLFSAACCIPVPLTITAPAILVPAKTQTIYAPASGIVDEVMVQYAQSVAAQQPILRIKSAEIENEYESLVAEKIQSDQRRRDIELQLLRSNELTPQQRTSLEGELQTISVVLRTQDERIALVEKQLASLEVKTGGQGVVGTWKIDSLLYQKPVLLGQPLAMIYDPEAEWGFEIELEERDIGAFLERVANVESPTLKCRLDSTPLSTIELKLEADSLQIMLHQNEKGQAIAPVYASVDPKAVPQLTPGASGTVELVVGKQPIIWVLTRDFVLSTWSKIRLWI